MSEIEWRKLQFTQKRLQSIPLFVTAFNHINIQELRLTIKTYKALYGIEVVGIDYLQLLSSLNTNKGGGLKNYEILADMVEQLRQLALECNILIVLASQLTRYEGDDRPGKLRERDLAQLAGGVTAGQAAHVVLILQSLKIKNGFFPDLKRAPELICIQLLKNRGGPPSFKEGVGHHIQNGKGTVVVLNAAKMTIADLPSYINLNAAIDED
jgi:replicative DNA helicase